jgi:hypothetical protein
VDYISSYSKMHVFQPAPDRLFVLMAAGNLGTTQAVLNRIRRDLAVDDASTAAEILSAVNDGPASAPPPRPRSPGTAAESHDLLTARYLFEAADYVGRLSVAVQRAYSTSLQQAGASGEASFILGGQIAGQPHGLYLIYPQGNAITVKANWNLVDPWGETIRAYPCVRPATRGEMKNARDLLKAGSPTAAADSTAGYGIDMEDGTVRTKSEQGDGFACRGRQWLFISKGPDRLLGRPQTDTDATAAQKDANSDGINDWDDNVLSYEPVRPNP